MIPQVVTVGPLDTDDPDGISLSQTAADAQALTITGALATDGVATLDVPRRVLISSAGDDSAVSFRVTGTNHTGNPIRETVAGTNAGTAYTVQDFKTVTEVTTSAATAGAVTVGTNGIASSAWQAVNYHLDHVNISFGVIVSGTVDYTLEYTYDNPNNNQNVLGSQGDPGNYPAVLDSFSHASLVAQSTNLDGVIEDPIFAWRLTLNSQTNPGFAKITSIQAGIA